MNCSTKQIATGQEHEINYAFCNDKGQKAIGRIFRYFRVNTTY